MTLISIMKRKKLQKVFPKIDILKKAIFPTFQVDFWVKNYILAKKNDHLPSESFVVCVCV